MIVLGQDDAFVGLIVDHIVDGDAGYALMCRFPTRELVLIGTRFFGGRPAELIDPSHYLAAAHGFVTRHASSHPRVLLVDDNVFSGHATSVLNGAGYQLLRMCRVKRLCMLDGTQFVAFCH